MNNYEEGGLKLPHIEAYCYALKNVLDSKTTRPNDPFSMETTPFKIEKIGGDKVWLLKKVGIKENLY